MNKDNCEINSAVIGVFLNKIAEEIQKLNETVKELTIATNTICAYLSKPEK